MGTGALTHLRTNTDLTPYIDGLDAFSLEFQANRLNSLCSFRLRDETGALTGLFRERDEIAVTDGGTRIYGGSVAVPTISFDGKAILYDTKCQSFDSYLDFRVIESGLRDATLNRYDDSDAVWIISFAADLGLAATTYVSRIRTLVLETIDYSGLTLRKALDRLASACGGATYWIDENKQLHWLNPSSAQLVKNNDFESGGTNWALDASASAVDGNGPGGTGDSALTVTGNGTGTHNSTQTVTGITGNRRYLFYADVYATVASAGVVTLDWKNSSHVIQRTDVLNNGSLLSTWTRKKSVYTAPATATEVTISLGVANNSTASARFDNVTLVGETAAWGVSTQPNGTTTRHMLGWKQPSDATTPINRVLIRGTGISGWREHAASIGFYGGTKYEGVLDDERVTTTDGIDSRAAWVFAKYAFPQHSGSYSTDQTGLIPGTWQIVEVPAIGQQSIEWIATIKTYFVGNGLMGYDVTYGAPEDDMGAVLGSMATAYSGTTRDVGSAQPPTLTPDVVAPAVPTGLALSTGTRQALDGTARPWLLATWTANTDTDFDAYELALDRAITSMVTYSPSASGTGGTLPAGTYAVQVTAIGAAGGETGTTTAPILVTLTAGQRLYVNITALGGASSYNIYASVLGNNQQQPKLWSSTSTTGSNVEITAAGTGVFPPATSTAFSFLNPSIVRLNWVSFYSEDVIGGVLYGARIRAIDISGNESAWSSVVTMSASADSTAPATPTGLTATPGFRLVGCQWGRSTEPDFLSYQVRYAPDNGSGAPDTTQWQTLTTSANWIVITGLDPAKTYYFEVRSGDNSGNWSAWSNDAAGLYVSARPSAIGAADIAAGSITADRIAASGIDASLVTTGTLKIGGASTAQYPDFLLIYDSTGREIGRWDANGFLIKDTANTLRQMRLLNGTMSFSGDGGVTWTTAIDAFGVRADAILLGTMPGGHNAMPNASYELAAFVSSITVIWETNQPWATTIGTDVNVTKNTADLRLTTAIF